MLSPDRAFVQTLDPMRFFLGRTLGQGIVRDLTGRVIRRCIIDTQSHVAEEYDALYFDETYTYDDGSPPDQMHWVVQRTGQDDFQAREVSVSGRLRSQIRGSEWRLRFLRKPEPSSHLPRLLYDVRFNQVTEDVVTKQVNLRLFGLTVARLWAFHRKV